MDKPYDLLFAGAGGAGLALLYALHQQGSLASFRVAIVEPSGKNTNDRTWSYWSTGEEAVDRLFTPMAVHSWSQVELPSGNVDMAPYHYHQVQSRDFYAQVIAALKEYPQVEWIADQVEALRPEKDRVWVELKQKSQALCSLRVFDSRPPIGLVPRSELLWQSFVGWRIRCSEAHFAPDTCVLMDFEVPQMGATQFMYLLPTAPHEALVEFTRFGRAVLSEAEAQPVLEDYLRQRGIEDFEILEKEINKIPMTLALRPRGKFHEAHQRVIPLGTRAGVVKASTGYAFKSMALHAEVLAQALKSGAALPQPFAPWRFGLYDEMLMRILSEKSHLGKKIFQTLFARRSLSLILCFLDERTRLPQELNIMYAMPWAPFLWSLGHTLRGHRSLKAGQKIPRHAP